jgi:hypothetical protein
LFFEFATPVVQEFERLNSHFQQIKDNSHELYKYSHIRRVFRTDCMMPKDRKINHQVDFGVNFLTACNKFPQQNNAEDHLEMKKKVKVVCLCKKKLSVKLHVGFHQQEI